MLAVEEALAVVGANAFPLAAGPVPLGPAALGLVLAEDVASDVDSPPFAKSVMDGFAVRAADAARPPVELAVVGVSAAGGSSAFAVASGQAARIMTGAALPPGTDAVVPFEACIDGGERVTLTEPVAVGAFVLDRGREMRAGEVVLAAGLLLGPAELGLLAAVGRTSVAARPRPRVAILSTGDELVEPGALPGPNRIRNTNGPMLSAQAVRAGAVPDYLGVAGDDKDALRNLAAAGLHSADVLVVSGGVSAGDFDLVPSILEEVGVEVQFHKVRFKPGKPILFGLFGSKLAFGLPGDPVSSFASFELFVRPALRRLAGQADPGPTFVRVPLATDLSTDNDRITFAPARVEADVHGIRVRPVPWFGSADLRALVGVDALIRLPEGPFEREAGDGVPTLMLGL